MAAVQLTNAAPVLLASTVLATESLSYDPGGAGAMFRHSGLPYSSAIIQSALNPTLTFRTPFEAVYGVLGLTATRLTTVEFHQRTYTNIERDTGTVKYALASSASAVGFITNVSEGAAGVIMADVTLIFLSADGTTNPVAEQASDVDGLALSAEPQKQVRGPLVVNGTTLEGVSSFSLATGIRAIGAAQHDGDTYPQTVIDDGGDFVLNIGTSGIKKALATITNPGSSISSNVVVYLRDVTSDGIVHATAGVSFTVAAGRVNVMGLSQSTGSTDSGTIQVQAINSAADGAIPIAVNLSATVP